jgi:hypothetical protein
MLTYLDEMCCCFSTENIKHQQMQENTGEQKKTPQGRSSVAVVLAAAQWMRLAGRSVA